MGRPMEGTNDALLKVREAPESTRYKCTIRTGLVDGKGVDYCETKLHDVLELKLKLQVMYWGEGILVGKHTEPVGQVTPVRALSEKKPKP